MKKCPTCNRTYADDMASFCLTDGSLLSAPYTTEAPQHVPASPTFTRQISANHFRILIVVSFLLSLISVLLHFATLELLPAPLRIYLTDELNSPLNVMDVFTLVVMVPLALLTLVAWIGLFFFKRWARTLLPFIIIAGVLFIAFIGPTVEIGLVSSLSYLSTLADGIILALAFFSPISERFKR